MSDFNTKLTLDGPKNHVEELARTFAFHLFNEHFSTGQPYEMTRFTYENGNLEVTFRWNEQP